MKEAQARGINLVSAYTREDALQDGQQVDVSEDAQKAGFRFPVYMTRSAFAEAIETGGRWVYDPTGDGELLELPRGQSVPGRMQDVLFMLRLASKRGGERLEFSVKVSGRMVGLIAQCGPRDIDDPSPAITIMRPEDE